MNSFHVHGMPWSPNKQSVQNTITQKIACLCYLHILSNFLSLLASFEGLSLKMFCCRRLKFTFYELLLFVTFSNLFPVVVRPTAWISHQVHRCPSSHSSSTRVVVWFDVISLHSIWQLTNSLMVVCCQCHLQLSNKFSPLLIFYYTEKNLNILTT